MMTSDSKLAEMSRHERERERGRELGTKGRTVVTTPGKSRSALKFNIVEMRKMRMYENIFWSRTRSTGRYDDAVSQAS